MNSCTDLDLIEDNVFAVWGPCQFCAGRRCETCDYSGREVAVLELGPLLHNLAVAGAMRAAEIRGYLDGVKAGVALCDAETTEAR